MMIIITKEEDDDDEAAPQCNIFTATKSNLKSNQSLNDFLLFYFLIDKKINILKRATKRATHGIQNIYTNHQKPKLQNKNGLSNTTFNKISTNRKN